MGYKLRLEDLPPEEEDQEENPIPAKKGKYKLTLSDLPPEEEESFKDKLRSEIESSANSPAINTILGSGDALVNLLSAGYVNPKSSEGTAYNVGNVAGTIAPYLLVEGIVAKGIGKVAPKMGNFLRKLLASTITAGGQSALETPGHRLEAGALGAGAGATLSGASQLASKLSPLLGTPIRAGLGGLAGYQLGGKTGAAIGASGGALAPYVIPGLAERLGERAALQGVDLQTAQSRLDAARRLGIEYLTPAESTGSPFVAANQGAVGRTGEGSQLAYNKGKSRLESERKSIKGLLDEVYNEKVDDPKVEALYKSAYKNNMSPTLVENAKQSSSIIKSAFDKVKSDPIYQDKLKGIPENNFAYLDQVKRAMDDMRQSALNSREKDRARLIGQQVDAMKGLMDKINPDYKAARELSERGIVRSAIEKKINDKDIIGTNFYNKFLRNDNQFDKLKFSLRNVPGATQKLDDMRMIFQDLINPRTVKTAFGKTEHGMQQNRNFYDAVKDLISNVNGKRYDKAFIELISNPHWDKEFNRIMGIPNKSDKILSLSNLLSRASSYGISESLKDKEETNRGEQQ